MKSNIQTLWNAIEQGYVATIEELKRFEKELRKKSDEMFTLEATDLIKEILGE